MKFIRLFAIAALFIAVASRPAAALSLQPLFSDKECEAAPEILGDWTGNTDLSGTWTLQQVGERKYRLVEQADEANAEKRPAFDICVAHLGGKLFFDATSQYVGPDGKPLLGDDFPALWIPIHIIGRLDVEKDAMLFRLLDEDWLQGELQAGRVRLATALYDGSTLLTAPSKELKEFAARFAKDPKAFSYEENFERAPKKNDAKKN